MVAINLWHTCRLSATCAVKGNPMQFNLVSCTLQRKFKQLKQNKTK